jgi:hypothetical protein
MVPNNPAFMTVKEYLQVTNRDRKYHDDSSYDVDLAKLSNEGSYAKKENYDKLLRRLKIKGQNFDFYFKDDKPWGFVVSAFNEDGERVGGTQDEWGAMLVRVAREYRGFGLGPILVKMARTMEPFKDSGGFTSGGKANLIKVHREFVRDALNNGTYSAYVREGKMSMDRVKEIIQSAQLAMRPKKSDQNLNSNDPKDWMLYVGGYGDFIMYDKKLKDTIEDPHGFWSEKMMKGYVLVREPRDKIGILVQFGGDGDKMKTFMMTCAMWFCKTNGIQFHVDPEDRKFVDPKFGKVSVKPNTRLGHKRYNVNIGNDIPNINDFGLVEKHFRQSFDQYDELKNGMMELANSKFQQYNYAKAVGESLCEDAFHGSPHQFTQFSNDYANTGSGSHMFGWGLYFASQKRHAETFKKNGRVYEVTIPDENELLNWDEDMANQAPAVRQIILANNLLPSGEPTIVKKREGWYDVMIGWAEVGGSSTYEGASEIAQEADFDPMLSIYGMSLYRALTERLGSQKAASLYLRDLGIKGIAYNAGVYDEIPHYVVFDANNVHIKG